MMRVFGSSRCEFWLILVLALISDRHCWAQSQQVSQPVTQPRPASNFTRPVPTSTYWLAGAALGCFATSGVLLASALSSREHARNSCAPRCGIREEYSIEATLLTADIMSIAGAALSGLTLYTYWSRPALPQEEARPISSVAGSSWVRFTALRSGGTADFSWEF